MVKVTETCFVLGCLANSFYLDLKANYCSHNDPAIICFGMRVEHSRRSSFKIIFTYLQGNLMPCLKIPPFMLFPLNWPYCLQMHNLPCINCFEWICLLNSFFLTVMKNVFNSWDEGLDQRKCFQCVCPLTLVEEWNQCESGQASFTVYQGHQPSFKSLRGDEGENDLWPWPFTWLCVCVCLCLPVSWLWRALWPHCWVMRCLVWRLRTNKHSALFYSTHRFCVHCSVEDCVWLFLLG